MSKNEIKDEEIRQWAKEVSDFSSQYGSETSISYTVANITGPPNIYPDYGDFTQAAVLRTYGPWWKLAPSYNKHVYQRPSPKFVSEDFIELCFEMAVYPTDIIVYETYNPGSVVRILACNYDNNSQDPGFCLGKKIEWIVLWEGQAEKAPTSARKFSPKPLRKCPFPTNVLRLEFNSTNQDYYTELDAVQLCGRPASSTDHPTIETINNGPHRSNDMICLRNNLSHMEGVNKTLASLHLQDGDGLTAALEKTDNGHFDLLPEEVIQEILCYLDLRSLCALASVSRLFYHHCYDPLQYRELNLKPLYHQVDDSVLDGLRSRCHHLHYLDLSWCGVLGKVLTCETFSSFLVSKELVVLKLANCNFFNNTAMKAVCQQCPQIQELDIQGCRDVDNFGFVNIARLQRLTSLNLYRTMIDIHSLTAVIRSCSDLETLNLGSCVCVSNYNDVAVELATHCKKLRCLDLWRARSLSEVGLAVLAQYCPLLEELDIGWCSTMMSSSGCFVDLFRKCPRLKKIFLTANRSVCDRDLEALIQCCPLMEQIDILGTREVSTPTAQKVLEQCRNLCFFDISFCSGIDFSTMLKWRKMYPNVSIKKSYQTTR